MKKILNSLPDDWLFQFVTLSMITTTAYYIIELFEGSNFVKEFWAIDKKYYIYTFLGMQLLVKVLFYWLLLIIIRKYLFNTIKDRVISRIRKPKTRDDLKTAIFVKQFIIKILGVPIEMGLLEKEDFDFKFEINDEDLLSISKNITKWFCATIHFGLTSLLIMHLNAYYIIPLLFIILLFIILVWYAISFLIGNIQIIEKARIELVENSSYGNKIYP